MLKGEDGAAEALMRYAGALGGEVGGRGNGVIAEDLEANGGVGVEEPGEGVHEAMVANAFSVFRCQFSVVSFLFYTGPEKKRVGGVTVPCFIAIGVVARTGGSTAGKRARWCGGTLVRRHAGAADSSLYSLRITVFHN
jgi:hypothetical protein